MKTSEIVTTLAAYLAAVTGWAWDPAGAYASTQTGIFYGRIGTTPNRACGITLYATSDEPGDQVAGPRRVQFRFRGEPNRPASADDMADAAFDGLQGAMRVGGLLLIKRVSSAQLGIDGNGRPERADNYEIQPDLEA